MRDLPHELHVFQLLRARRFGRHDFQCVGIEFVCVWTLHQQAAAHALHFQCIGTLIERLQRYSKNAHIRFLGEQFQRVCRVLWRDEHFEELLAHCFGAGRVDGAIECNDAAKRGGRIGRQCAVVRNERRVAKRDSTRIRMLHDHAASFRERAHAFPCGIGVADVVVREFFALQLRVLRECASGRRFVAIERSALMRVLAVSHVLRLSPLHREHIRVGAWFAFELATG